MKTLKNLAIFMAGGFSFMYLYAYAHRSNSEYPREGSIEYEDDRIKVIRMSKEPAKEGDYSIATIVYKKHSEEEGEA